ncbi:filamentation induced by cAMP protein Fic [Delftia acidovorans SPH-1]|jgi:Fic family protein|uniref:Filamentation induced by cAMP protein Fic n=1 Tax=Delftia acidovorans (strain DSM 14801 / SPH-1) TaxID=398578 RepID=A9BSA8_DELAS|nr:MULTISPECIES: Fic family protein [Delftia]MCP4018491.1 Fic family protein [Delftia sp.]OLE95479.1 MAG: cell filamentation protein Fic [Delftia sp. 13_1_40CM_3_66_6]ABX33722.1 filamentation induced by cAMP protein Fic [Delftia acidovorans SPH-1]MCP4517826.1 Fic family protein [Delftia sp.]MCP4530357.1 Fic family protein [Delftia sp.]
MPDSPTSQRLGRFIETSAAGEKVRAFVPPPLPPEPAIDVLALLEKLSLAERALGRLDGITMLLPRQELFLYMYVRKEAVLSSQIEGTQSTLSDLLRFEAEAQAGQPIDDIREVSNYVDAMMYGLERLRDLPLSLRLIREMHGRLLQSARGGTKSPGEFRRSQNWIGGTRPGNALFVPPPVNELGPCLDAFERFMHEDASRLPALIKAGLLHVQFETLHPFLDGNGRIGRLLVTLYLCINGVLNKPLLYLSLFLKTHRAEYYRLLQEVRENGNWEAWLDFFLTGVAQTANQAFEAATHIVDLFRQDRERIATEGERANSTLRIHDLFQLNPFLTSNQLVRQTGLSSPTVNTALADLQRLGIIEEVTGRKRGRVFSYRRYLSVLNEGTDPLPRPA